MYIKYNDGIIIPHQKTQEKVFIFLTFKIFNVIYDCLINNKKVKKWFKKHILQNHLM